MDSIGVLDDVAAEDFRRLITQVETRTRFQGRFYKDKCLRRRVAARMRARGVASIEGYSRLLDRDPEEYDLLLDALTINVTKFFRDFEAWEVIRRQVVPGLFDMPGAELRIWSAGCASGEEAYSVSILLREWAEQHGRETELDRFRIVGTDIDRRSLQAARRAEYAELSMVETPEPIRRRWFSPGPPFRLRAEARESTSFELRDVITDPPEQGQSLILCRNVIIYLEREIQMELFQRFYDALVPGGYLVMGKVETLLGPTRPRFLPISTRERIFRKPGG